MPTNSSAPTLIGYHKSAICPRCGGLMVIPYDPERDTGIEVAQPASELGICRACLQTSEVNDVSAEIGPRDRFVCNKLLFPRRWDLAVFRAPSNPSELWVKRLVGLPGEKIFFQDGAVWIDGKELGAPADIANLAVGATGPMDRWATREQPAQLGPDEFFVVGDFALRSSDSLNWGVGAEGHPSYAVPRSYIVGVAAAIYWPPSRWRIFR